MFHVEVRRFPHVARAFNLDQDELQSRVVLPWVRRIPIVLEDRQWTSEKTRLTIYEGPEIEPQDMGMGRGWSTVTREGREITEAVLAPARAELQATSPSASLPELKRELVAAAARQELPLSAIVSLLNERNPTWRPSQRLEVAERAVWELLQSGQLKLAQAGEPVPPEQWERVLLVWDSWAGGAAAVRG